MNRLTTAAALALVATPALAHHPLAGAPMETFAHGLLSGVGHPLLGFDHLFFVLAVGVAALFTGRALTAPLAFLAAMAAGVALSGGAAFGFVEPMIAVSLLILGGLVAWGRALSLPVALAAFAGLGVFHGLAFGGSLAGVEGAASGAVLIGYLIGLAAIQWAIAVGFGMVVSRIWGASSAGAAPARLSGAMVAGVGAFLCLEVAEGAAFAALGIG
ncbi:MAG: HupE/UreJ family protein [Pseudomonadota bacterium]